MRDPRCSVTRIDAVVDGVETTATMASHVAGCECPTEVVARRWPTAPKGSIRYLSPQEVAERFVADIEEELL